MKPTTLDTILGAGHLYFDQEDAAGSLTGERYLGETPGFTINGQTTNLQRFTSDSQLAELAVDVDTQVTRTGAMTVDHAGIDNLAPWLIGEASVVSQSSGSPTGETPNTADGTVKTGRWYQVGATAADPNGVRDISSFSLSIDPNGTPVGGVEGTDYDVELETGRVYIIPGGGISDGDEVEWDYDMASTTYDEVQTVAAVAAKGALRFVANNTNGPNRDLYIPRCTLVPNGDLAFKSREQFMQLQFNLRIAKRDGLPQMFLNGRPA